MRVIKTDAKLFQSALLVGMVASMVACKSAEDQQPPEPSLTDSEQINKPEQKPVAAPMNLNGQIAFSKEDLAQRLDVPPDSVKVSSASQVTWRSGALGCPEPGMNYTEALVPGSVIYLQVDNVIHAYHAKFAGEPFYCPRERVEPPVLDDGADPT
jgi:hypothetical protein